MDSIIKGKVTLSEESWELMDWILDDRNIEVSSASQDVVSSGDMDFFHYLPFPPPYSHTPVGPESSSIHKRRGSIDSTSRVSGQRQRQ